jgi:lysophospholipase L1-like esterase
MVLLAGLGGLASMSMFMSMSGCAPRLVRPSDPRIAVMGRVDRGDDSRWRVGYPGVTFRVAFEGSSLRLRGGCTTANCRLDVSVDGGPPRVVRLDRGDSELALAEGLPAGAHTLEIVQRTEAWQGIVSVRGFVAPHGTIVSAPAWPQRRLLFIGDSVTCGEAIDRDRDGIDRGADCAIKRAPAAGANGSLSYGMLLGRSLSAQAHLVCYGGRGLIRDWGGRRDVPNGPQIFDLAVADDRPRAFWDHAGYIPDLVVVSLGTNDFNLALGDFPAREEFVTAYVAFARAIRARYPAAAIILTEGAIVSDQQTDPQIPQRPQKTVLREYLAETARRLADPRIQVFPSQHYPGDACNPHPTREQHAAMARDLEPLIRRMIGW